jgi:uncharacterized damage-inducible protein DinB
MRTRIFLALALSASPALGQAPTSPDKSAVAAVRDLWKSNMEYIIQAAADVPEDKYAFKPTPEVRSFRELFGHVAGAQAMFCAMALSETPPAEDAIEKSVMTKTAMIEALKKSTRDCERAYAQTDAALTGMTDVFGQQRTRLWTLMMNAQHNGEHYGNLVTYLRMNGIVPPSSRPR